MGLSGRFARGMHSWPYAGQTEVMLGRTLTDSGPEVGFAEVAFDPLQVRFRQLIEVDSSAVRARFPLLVSPSSAMVENGAHGEWMTGRLHLNEIPILSIQSSLGFQKRAYAPLSNC